MLRHRLITLLATIPTFVGRLAMVSMVGTKFVAPADDGRIAITAEIPVGSSLDYTTARLEKLEVALTEFPGV
ncbi:efflux RND transporter permease subunit [Paracoccus siganidrum]|uniref:efflux RND transporter permease subunit n=1 Tax=Paracoccus siganidrum TaxID=1276757 RepID=UPI001F0BEC91|nr:efflux RND transporter permease subunit [Paracoccus siganidrum]